jgi:hypothetical protein
MKNKQYRITSNGIQFRIEYRFVGDERYGNTKWEIYQIKEYYHRYGQYDGEGLKPAVFNTLYDAKLYYEKNCKSEIWEEVEKL